MDMLTFLILLSFDGYVFGLEYDNFLLVANGDSVYQLNVSTEATWKLHIENETMFLPMSYDFVNKTLYWTSDGHHAIMRTQLSGGNVEMVRSMLSSFYLPREIAIDPVSRLMYCLGDAGFISVLTLDGLYQFTLRTGLTQPSSLTLFPARGTMYWIEKTSRINTAWMDGSNFMLLTVLTYVITGLAVDPERNVLFWCSNGIVGTVSLTEKKVDGYWRKAGSFISIASIGGSVYFVNTSKDNSSIVKMTVSVPVRYTKVKATLFTSVGHIEAFNKSYQTEGHTCRSHNGRCAHICLATPSKPRCACLFGFNIDRGGTCVTPKYRCPVEYTATSGRIESPGYPSTWNNVHCEIIIHVQKNQRVLLRVDKFNLDGSHAFLLIGPEQFSGSKLKRGDTFIAKHSIWLFVTDGTAAQYGFSFSYEVHNVTFCSTDNSCINGGTCIEKSFCLCLPGYTGKRCQQLNRCGRSSPCLHSGTCRTDGKCVCTAEYSGARCERPEDHCLSRPCLNGGTCRSTSSTYTCVCPEGTEGQRCEPVNPCHSHPCRNGGTCRSSKKEYTCTCPTYTEGHDCEKDNPCARLLCRNGGSCVSDVTGGWCRCLSGFTGNLCDQRADIITTTATPGTAKGVSAGAVAAITCCGLVIVIALTLGLGIYYTRNYQQMPSRIQQHCAAFFRICRRTDSGSGQESLLFDNNIDERDVSLNNADTTSQNKSTMSQNNGTMSLNNDTRSENGSSTRTDRGSGQESLFSDNNIDERDISLNNTDTTSHNNSTMSLNNITMSLNNDTRSENCSSTRTDRGSGQESLLSNNNIDERDISLNNTDTTSQNNSTLSQNNGTTSLNNDTRSENGSSTWSVDSITSSDVMRD